MNTNNRNTDELTTYQFMSAGELTTDQFIDTDTV
jgi:hypothetical protein